jgi:ABC-type branched-subunit amino acid transport system substrate-binding protein
MALAQKAGVTNFTGGEAAGITRQGNPYVFRSSFTQLISMPKVSRYLKGVVKAGSVAVMFTNNDFGKGCHDAMLKAFDERFMREFKYKSDHNGMKGYITVYAVKAMTGKIGKFDSKALAEALHGANIQQRKIPAC